MTKVTKKLTEVSAPLLQRLWAELAGDSRLESLRYLTLGWFERKPVRVAGVRDLFAISLVTAGTRGTFRDGETGERVEVRGAGVFFTQPGVVQDYGPARAEDRWEEFYWTLEGERVREWIRLGWWDGQSRFWAMSAAEEQAARAVFAAARTALERRDGRELDLSKLALEKWVATGPWAQRTAQADEAGGLAAVVADWRRDPARAWSLPEEARRAGMSYTRFRARFAAEYGRSPHAYLRRWRLELAMGWLRATTEPIKTIAERCGFAGAEPFIRAFAQVHGTTPGRWRAMQARATRAAFAARQS